MTALAQAEPDQGGAQRSNVLYGRSRTIAFATVALGMLLAALDRRSSRRRCRPSSATSAGATHVSGWSRPTCWRETIASALAGKLGDLFGRKLVFQVSVIIFITGPLFCGLAGSMEWLIVSRAIQGHRCAAA